MNKLSLSSDSRSWWLPSAIVGGIGTVAVGAILILPTSGQSASDKDAPDAPAVSVPSGHAVGHSCFAQRPPRPFGADEFPQPVCK